MGIEKKQIDRPGDRINDTISYEGVKLNDIKSTSFGYGEAYQLNQAQKYRNRKKNHWKHRIKTAKDLVENHVLPRLKTKPKQESVVVDVGCSIGTFAIEFSKMGYSSYGIDFDASALKIAKQLAQEEKVKPEFHCGDVSNWKSLFPPIDIAICFDLFEHLHDDELGAFLVMLKKQLSQEGCLVFHTFPTQYDHIFNTNFILRFPLFPFVFLSASLFNRIVKCYSCLVDIAFLWFKGMTYKEKIKNEGHCNPLTKERLTDIFHRAGYDLLFFESSNLYGCAGKGDRLFARQPITDRNLYGVAIPSAN